jgi:hypothetical protein
LLLFLFFSSTWYLVSKGLEIIENVTKSLGVSRPVVRKMVFLLERVLADCVDSLQGDRYMRWYRKLVSVAGLLWLGQTIEAP